MLKSSVIPNVTITKAIGASPQFTDRSFGNLAKVGGWPFSQDVEHIQALDVYATDSTIRGIRITYLSHNGELAILHGQPIGTRHRIPLDSTTMIIAGVCGGMDETGRISTISFMRFDTSPTASQPLQTCGPFGSITPARNSFGTFGHIIALIGTDNNDTGLRSLGFAKAGHFLPGLI